jgi:hypothetical protein
MGFLGKFVKNMAIKRVTKKRFDQLMGLIENDPRLKSRIESNQVFDPMEKPRHFELSAMETLRDYIRAVELSGGTIEEPPNITHWWDLFRYLHCLMVQSELAYDPTMGSEQDLNLIIETANKELEKWKRESILKKFIRREMIISKGDKFLKRSWKGTSPIMSRFMDKPHIIPAYINELRKATNRISTGWICGSLIGGLYLLFYFLMIADIISPPDGIVERNLNVLLITALLVFVLSYGVYQKSRVCAIILGLFLFYTIIGAWGAFQGIRGTFGYHKLAKSLEAENAG